MATYDNTRQISGGHLMGGRPGIIGTLIAAFAEWNDARVTRKALGRLSDHELDDIGLVRGDLDRITRAEFPR